MSNTEDHRHFQIADTIEKVTSAPATLSTLLISKGGRLDAMQDKLAKAGQSVRGARQQVEKIRTLQEESSHLQLTIRQLNRFLTVVMEGRVGNASEEFSQFLIARVHDAPDIPADLRQLLELYISVVYGDQNLARIVPTVLAVREGLFRDTTASMQRQVNERERAEILEDYRRRRAFAQDEHDRRLTSERERKQKLEDELLTYITPDPPDTSGWRLNEPDTTRVLYWRCDEYFGGPGGGSIVPKRHGVHIGNLTGTYVLFLEYPSVRKVLDPFLAARFAPSWRKHLPEKSTLSLILDNLEDFSREAAEAWKEKAAYERRHTVLGQLLSEIDERDERPRGYYHPYVHSYVIEALVKFLRQYGEGAIVALVMLEIAKEEPGRWMVFEKNKSLGYNMRTHVPALVNHEPLEILLVLDRLNEILAGCKI